MAAPGEDIVGDDDAQVEQILNHRTLDDPASGQIAHYYQVKWLGYDDMTWEAADNVPAVTRQAFHNDHGIPGGPLGSASSGSSDGRSRKFIFWEWVLLCWSVVAVRIVWTCSVMLELLFSKIPILE